MSKLPCPEGLMFRRFRLESGEKLKFKRSCKSCPIEIDNSPDLCYHMCVEGPYTRYTSPLPTEGALQRLHWEVAFPGRRHLYQADNRRPAGRGCPGERDSVARVFFRLSPTTKTQRPKTPRPHHTKASSISNTQYPIPNL